MRFETFSERQAQVLSWWSDASPYRDMDAVICDGAVRSGKTLCMGISFLCWATRRFDGKSFGLCGKTIVSLRRNVVNAVLPVMRDLGFEYHDQSRPRGFVLPALPEARAAWDQARMPARWDDLADWAELGSELEPAQRHGRSPF